jgi:hypothetical protein
MASGVSNLTAAAHSQNDAINAARSTESFESLSPDSIIGISATAARNRFSSAFWLADVWSSIILSFYRCIQWLANYIAKKFPPKGRVSIF